MIMAVNGSPRKDFNTAVLLRHALEGAASKGAQTELIHLSEINFRGCMSCFSCKKKGSKSFGKCAVKDGLTPVLEKFANSDGLVLGSPCYIGSLTGAMHSFLERLIFPYASYEGDIITYFEKKIPIGLIYDMGATEALMKERGYEHAPSVAAGMLKRYFGYSEVLLVHDTYQFDDYAKYAVSRLDPVAKAKRLKEEFPKDCAKAFDMGVRFAEWQ